MKMITAIVNKKDAGEVCDALKDEKFTFTKMATTGGFLLKTVLFNLLRTVKTEKLFNLELNRKSVGIPACLTGNHITLHSSVTGNHILYYTCEHVSYMRLTVSCRRSVIECV